MADQPNSFITRIILEGYQHEKKLATNRGIVIGWKAALNAVLEWNREEGPDMESVDGFVLGKIENGPPAGVFDNGTVVEDPGYFNGGA